MNIIVCIDDEGGMLFNGRRQSKDRLLRQQARLLANGQPLWMNAYTARQFAEDGEPVIIDEAFSAKAPQDAWCFVEDPDLIPSTDKIQQVALYRWNRLYPSDVKFPMALFEGRWEQISTREFAGNSHEKITQEVYRL